VHGILETIPENGAEIRRDRFIPTRKTIALPPLTMTWQVGADRGLNNQVMRGSCSMCFAVPLACHARA
jgi:hypothetical protein